MIDTLYNEAKTNFGERYAKALEWAVHHGKLAEFLRVRKQVLENLK